MKSLRRLAYSIKLLRIVLLAIFLISCGGTFTHRGQHSARTELNLSDDQQQTKNCYAVCNQTNPDEECESWLMPTGIDCLNQLERK